MILVTYSDELCDIRTCLATSLCLHLTYIAADAVESCRFDHVYTVYFKCNKKSINQYTNISNYVKDVFQIPGGALEDSQTHSALHEYLPQLMMQLVCQR